MKRLESLDVVRGLDMFFLTTLGPVLMKFFRAFGMDENGFALGQLEHVPWEGLVVWDMIMPFFMFCAGSAIPFAMEKYREGGAKRGRVYRRIARRVVVLWILGMVCQGRLLTLNPAMWVYFSNTLQSIAVGYLVSALMFLNTRPKTQISLAGALLLLYWALMTFVRVDRFGGGDFTPQWNLCEWVDRTVLGVHCDHASIDSASGAIIFRETYNYTWVLSSLNFIATVMSGMFAGELMKSRRFTEKRKVLVMSAAGAAMVISGWLWSLQMPVIKHIWTSSMTLVTSGWSFLTMALFYWLCDIRKIKGLGWLKVYGMNCILVYMLVEFMDFRPLCRQLLFGLEKHLPEMWYEFVIECSLGLLIWFLLRFLYRQKFFLKV